MEIPEFGKVIMKVFIQLIGILRWSLKENLGYMNLVNNMERERQHDGGGIAEGSHERKERGSLH